MCGRYVARWSKETFEQTFNTQAPLFESYNIAPTRYAPIVWQPQGSRETLEARWGLIPKWVDKPADFKANVFNARAETLADKASFKRPFRKQRCLVPASGFYEWTGEKGNKQPYYIQLEDERPLAFAGLWDYWQKDDDEITSYTIITTQPNELMSTIHNRMPVVLSKEHFEAWLDPESEGELLEELLRPFEGDLQAYKVDKRVGRTREDDPGLIEPLDEDES